MKNNPLDSVTLSALLLRDEYLTLQQVTQRVDISFEHLTEMLDEDPLFAFDSGRAGHLSLHQVLHMKRVMDLREDFELSAPAAALLFTALRRIRELESQVTELRCLLPGVEE